MKHKKTSWLFLALALVLIVSMFAGLTGADEEPCGLMVIDLIAGQNMVVGTVTVENDDEKVCVTYALDEKALAEGWLIYETHLAIATELAGIPQTSGNRWGTNPIPGQFPYGDNELNGVEEWSYCVSLEDLDVSFDEEVFIAAHAVVERIVEEAYCETVIEAGDDFLVSDTETMVVESATFSTPFNAELAWVHPSWNSSLSRPFDEDAEWIWESEDVVNPIDGDVVTFEKEFEVPGIPKDGTLFITADNGFAVYLNGEFLYNSPSLLQYPDLGDLKAAYVDRTGWQTVREVDLTDELVKGDNILTIIGVNEYQGPDDGFSDGTVTSNPGGVIFEFDVEWDEVEECYPDVWEDETAWGEGDRFNERGNWGMYFKYKICENENGECQTETAWGGATIGGGWSLEDGEGPWWYYYDVEGDAVQTLWAGRNINVGTVEVNEGKVTIVLTGGWELQDDDEPVKIQGYDEDELPDKRPTAGQFTGYKGTELTDLDIGEYYYYAIHLDVQLCE